MWGLAPAEIDQGSPLALAPGRRRAESATFWVLTAHCAPVEALLQHGPADRELVGAVKQEDPEGVTDQALEIVPIAP
jgi:hypothetical protein